MTFFSKYRSLFFNFRFSFCNAQNRNGIICFFYRFFFSYLYIQTWFFNVEDEATLFGYHTKLLKKDCIKDLFYFQFLIYAFLWIFLSFFSFSTFTIYSFRLVMTFRSSFRIYKLFRFTSLYTILLIFSGLTVTYAHVSIASSNHSILWMLYI